MLISESKAWKALQQHAIEIKETHLRSLLTDEQRCAALQAEHDGVLLDFSRQNMTSDTMDKLCEVATAANVEGQRAAMANGEHINNTEDRAVMHTALRAPRNKAVIVDGVNVVPGVHAVLDKVKAFTEKVRSGQWLGSTGKPLKAVVSIGIGGSYLGPEFVFEALKTDPEAAAMAQGRTLRFLANVDPVDVARALHGLDAESTLVIIVSKTFTTAETMLNARTVKDWLLKNIDVEGGADAIIRQHMAAVSTAIPKATAFGIAEENIFGFWDWVGGRYSVCSAVGVMPLALQYGFSVVESFLSGAHAMDNHFFTAPMKENLPVLLGLIGVWNASFMEYEARCILPYAQALVRFAAHIQQVDMESNGKRVSKDGEVLPYKCGEILFGEPGTNGQHSFYQLVHQGRTIPAEFIGYCKSPTPISMPGEVVSNHDELMSNFFAQPDALALGKTVQQLKEEGVTERLHAHKEFPGNRPSLSLLFDSLTPYSVGQLLSLYEHRVAVQGFIWGVNSFDQWGVELGKVLAGTVRNQLKRSRAEEEINIEGFNPSTSSMLKRYLQTK